MRAASKYGSLAQADAVYNAILRKAEKFRDRVALSQHMFTARQRATASAGLSGVGRGVDLDPGSMSTEDQGSLRGAPRGRMSSGGGLSRASTLSMTDLFSLRDA